MYFKIKMFPIQSFSMKLSDLSYNNPRTGHIRQAIYVKSSSVDRCHTNWRQIGDCDKILLDLFSDMKWSDSGTDY